MRSILFAISFVFCSAAIAQDVPRAEPKASLAGGTVYEWTSPQGAPYWYRIPKKVSKSSPPNLVLMLHGTGLKWGWAFWNYPIEAGRFRGDDIVIAPEGLTPGNGDTFNFVQGKTDGEQIAALIEVFRKEFPIGRVYLYGHSQGAFFCYWFAGEYPELVDGIVAHAGNVLQVKHSKESKEGVAIGILHGKADAVVPVDYAYRTEKIYKEQGYKNVKLYVVEGLTEQSGHWPLPVQVAEMFDWLDQVTEVSAPRALSRAVAELGRSTPDLVAVASSLARAKDLAKRDKQTADDIAFVGDLELVEVALAELRDAHAAELAELAELKARKAEYGAWAARFRSVHRVFQADAQWHKALSGATRNAKSHEKKCKKAIKQLGNPSAKAVRAARKALEQAPLAPSYETLRGMLERFVGAQPKGAKPKDDEDLKQLLESRREADAAGEKDTVRCTTEVMQRLHELHPELVSDDGREK